MKNNQASSCPEMPNVPSAHDVQVSDLGKVSWYHYTIRENKEKAAKGQGQSVGSARAGSIVRGIVQRRHVPFSPESDSASTALALYGNHYHRNDQNAHQAQQCHELDVLPPHLALEPPAPHAELARAAAQPVRLVDE